MPKTLPATCWVRVPEVVLLTKGWMGYSKEPNRDLQNTVPIIIYNAISVRHGCPFDDIEFTQLESKKKYIRKFLIN